jgi:hypothetical protein
MLLDGITTKGSNLDAINKLTGAEFGNQTWIGSASYNCDIKQMGVELADGRFCYYDYGTWTAWPSHDAWVAWLTS